LSRQQEIPSLIITTIHKTLQAGETYLEDFDIYKDK